MVTSSAAVASAASPKVHADVAIPERVPRGGPNATTTKIVPEGLQLRVLMRSAQAGDARAYAELLDAITPRLRQIISNQRTSLQQADIEDLVQEVLLSLHAVRGTYDPERPFMPWLIAITQYRLTDAARRYHRHAARQNKIEEPSATFAEETPTMEAEPCGDGDALKQTIERAYWSHRPITPPPPDPTFVTQLIADAEQPSHTCGFRQASAIDALAAYRARPRPPSGSGPWMRQTI